MESKNNSKYLKEKTYYINNNFCNYCSCINSYSCDYCQCRCHKDKFKDNNDIDFENAPNLNINELKMKALKDYSYKNQNINLNNDYPTLFKNLSSSKSSANIENYNNGKHLISLKKRIENNLEKIKMSCINKSQEPNYLNSQKNLKLNYQINDINENNKDIEFKEVASHYQTQNNFNSYKKYFQINNNMNNISNNNLNYNNNTLKSQIEFNKLLNSIKGNDNNLSNININNIDLQDSNIKYNNYTDRKYNYNTKINGYNNSSYEKISQIANYNNILRNTVNYNRNNRILEKYKDNNSNLKDFYSNTEYNKSFRTLNIDNGKIKNSIDRNINNNNNTSIQIPSNIDINSNNYSSRSSFIENNNNNNIEQNGGSSYKDILNSSKKLKLDEDSISYNSSTINKSYNKLFQNLDKNSNNSYNSNFTEPRYSNTSKNSENDNINIKLNYLETNSSQNENKLLESKDINEENNNNFIVTFGAKGNNEIKNIITSVKNELSIKNNNINNKDNGKREQNSDQKINNIIIDYENLKKRYAPNKLFIGLQNNIKDLNENININNNIILDNCSNKSTINTIKNSIYSQYRFDIFLKGDSDKSKKLIEENENYKKEIIILNNELKESNNKIDELMELINNYQMDIYALKDQIAKLKKDSLNESKNSFNNISTTNNNINSSNKTKIGKDSFIIKIPQSLIKNNLNKEKKSRNNSLSNVNNKNINTYSNISAYSNRNIQDKCKNLYNNFNNVSNISNNITNSNCLTNNNVSSSNISNNNISNINNEVYVKKITTSMKKRIKKSASQKLRINKVYKDLNLNLMNKDIYKRKIEYSSRNNNINIDNKLIYTLYQKDNRLIILSFDALKKQFNYINFSDNDNFSQNYYESFRDRGDNLLNSNSIFSNNNINNNIFYIVTGKNSDLLYKYNKENKIMKKLCKFNNNHAKGCLLFNESKIFCLSGYHNKKVEMFLEEENILINLDEMNIERCNFSACIIQNKYIFALFGYNYPTKQNLDSIEFYEIKNIDYYYNNYSTNSGWKFLKYKSNNLLNLNIEGHICFNCNDEKIIIFGGFNDENKAVDGFYELIIDGYDFNDEYSNRGIVINKIDKNLNDIYKNRCYFFGNNNGLLLKDINNNLIFTAFDNNSFVHILEIDSMMHNICYLE